MAGEMRRETVIVVHGTFDAPEVGLLKWYEPNGSFCKALDRALEQVGSKARCWAHLPNSMDPIFSWDGGNSIKASMTLLGLSTSITKSSMTLVGNVQRR
jgi:hypothetical protein